MGIMSQYRLNPDQIIADGGLAWIAALPGELGRDDTSDNPLQSTLVLVEDDRPLGPAHALHTSIRERGGGAYSHWNGSLYFSTSDGTDPRVNGRMYRVFSSIPLASTALGRASAMIEATVHESAQTPFNQHHLSFGDPVAAAEYDRQVFDAWDSQLTRWVGRTTELNILEVGPGLSLGAQTLLVERGNGVTVVDPFPPRWHPDFHPKTYRYLAKLVGGSPLLESAAEDGSFAATRIRQITEPAEDLRSLRDAEFDVVLSNAVLEHVADLERVCAELARITRPGGTNIHQIDLAYHKDRARPLDHLLLSDDAFLSEARSAHFEYGNRWRKSEFGRQFERAGFTVSLLGVTLAADANYLVEIGERLRVTGGRYAAWPLDDLGALSVLLVAKRSSDIPACR